jgi:hypothetical protein
MWAKVAEEMQVPWRAAEAMHWQLGEIDMARRAGVVPFSLNITSNEPQGPQRLSPSRGHAHSQSQGSLPHEISGLPSPRYSRGPPPMPPLIPPPTPSGGGRPLSSRRESFPSRPPSFALPSDHQPPDYGYGYGLAPIQTTNLGPPPSQGGRGGMLPSVAELTTGISPYNTPAYSVVGGPGPGGGIPSMSPSATASPGPGGTLLPALSPYPPFEAAGAGKRRASPPDVGFRETSRRRHLHPRGGVEEVEYRGGPMPMGGGYGVGPPGMGMGPGMGQGVPTRRGPRGGP